jgi:hypothetical protein
MTDNREVIPGQKSAWRKRDAVDRLQCSDLREARLWIVGVWHSISHVHQTSSRRDADASKQVGEPGIGAKGVPERLYFEVSETIEPLLVSLF